MRKQLFFTLLMVCSCVLAAGQHAIPFVVKDVATRHPLAGATAMLQPGGKTIIADSTGAFVISNLAAGSYSVRVTFVGYQQYDLTFTVTQAEQQVVEILLETAEEHAEEVVVTATRISRTLSNTPTRTEVISGEELVEKGNMKPGDIRMLLNESTGIQTQQTSATSFNAGIRIQGLEGRYTQLLRDGYPLYAGFSGSLSILQIAPLDLQQVEVIKGSASTLYGGGAIAGLVNLVSKTPGNERELNFLANGTSAGGLDLSGFYSERFGKAGLTLYAARNSNAPFDPGNTGFTAIPKFSRYTLNPRLFLYGEKTSADIGLSYITEDRTGGSMDYVKNNGSGFFETNNTDRLTAQAGVAHRCNEALSLQFKNSYSRFNRQITIPNHRFKALQQSTFSELTLTKRADKWDWVIGANLLTDQLDDRSSMPGQQLDYRYITTGLFVQHAWNITPVVTLESGLRGDYVNAFGFEWLPRAYLMIKPFTNVTTRIGGGYGYKPPTIFTEQTERMQFQQLLPVNTNRTQNERSIGANWDVDYRTRIGDMQVHVNHLFFYTKLNHPLVLTAVQGGKMELRNETGHIDTRGTETNLRLVYDNLKLFVGYTYTDAASNSSNSKQWLPLTARHRLNNVLMYEQEEKLKIGLEAYYFSRQQLNDGSFGRSYWIMGLMMEKLRERSSIFLNFENFTNTRQSRYQPIYTGSINNPVFGDIYAPVEGFVVNGGIKIRL